MIEIHALEGGGELLALFGATADDYRFSSMFNTYTPGENGRHSPVMCCLRHCPRKRQARLCAASTRGRRRNTNSTSAGEPQRLFDSFLPLSARGRLAALVFGTTFRGETRDHAKPDPVVACSRAAGTRAG